MAFLSLTIENSKFLIKFIFKAKEILHSIVIFECIKLLSVGKILFSIHIVKKYVVEYLFKEKKYKDVYKCMFK